MDHAGQTGEEGWGQGQPTLQEHSLSCELGGKETYLGSDLLCKYIGKEKEKGPHVW